MGRTDGAILKGEARRGLAQHQRVEVHEERADGVLVGLADARPQLVVALHDVVPLRLGRHAVVRGQPVAQQLLHGPRLRGVGVCEPQAARADVAYSGPPQHPHDLRG